MASRVVTACLVGLASGLQLLPPVQQHADFSVATVWEAGSSPKTIYLENRLASLSDSDGLTLIPPTGLNYATLFQADLGRITGDRWSLKRVDRLPSSSDARGILLGLSDNSTDSDWSATYEDGTPTSEGYELVVSAGHVTVRGSGARGMWWGTRTLLQGLLVGNGTITAGSSGTDAPAYRTRGFMLDAGRKWYAPSFLKELCSYASFFKLNEFHYHLSDNAPLSRGHNESWRDVYSHFSLRPDDPDLRRGLVPAGRENETLSRVDFEDLQRDCASRGVTVVPEIEAPGHCLPLTKWKPELALPDARDLLNLSHPDTLPTVKSVWSEFLPWFHVREVHIGADEYDADLADDYVNFVNDMAAFVRETADKRIRIWGTFEPAKNATLDRDVVVQHWQYGQSEPKELAAAGHDVVNSEDWWAYMSLKNDHTPILPAAYPQFFNEARVLNFADKPGRQWSPADFNPVNLTEQVAADASHLRGAVFAAWNDNGPDASTQLEAYYAVRRGLALVGARAWSGARGPKLAADDVASSVDFFSPRAPGQNLDRVLSDSSSTSFHSPYSASPSSPPSPLVSWSRSSFDGESVHLGRGSKGLNYTLTLSAAGPFSLSGPDDSLELRPDGSLVFVSDGWNYPLRSVTEHDALVLDPGQPGRIWSNVSASSHEPVSLSASSPPEIVITTDALHGSVAWVDGRLAGRFEVLVFGGHNELTSWSQMAFVAPLDGVAGGSGGLRSLSLRDGVWPPQGSGSSNAGDRTTSSLTLCLIGLAVFSLWHGGLI